MPPLLIFDTLQSMRAVFASLLAVTVLLVSTAWTVDAYGHGGMTAGGGIAVSAQHDPPPEPDVQDHASHHCGHLTQHFLGQPAADLPLGEQFRSVRFEPTPAPRPLSVSDTPTRPPRQRLS